MPTIHDSEPIQFALNKAKMAVADAEAYAKRTDQNEARFAELVIEAERALSTLRYHTIARVQADRIAPRMVGSDTSITRYQAPGK